MTWSEIEHCQVTVVTAGSSPRGEINSGSVKEGNIRPFFFRKLTVHYRVYKKPHRTVSTTDESSPHASNVRHTIL